MKAEPYLSVNPMGKVPAIVHKGRVVTEVAAICCYLADAFPEKAPGAAAGRSRGLLSVDFLHVGADRGRVQQQSRGFRADSGKAAHVRLRQLRPRHRHARKAIAGKEYIAADHFTAADLFVGANINFMLQFNLLDPRPAFVDYARRMTDRPAYERAKDIDGKLIAEIQARQPQPA